MAAARLVGNETPARDVCAGAFQIGETKMKTYDIARICHEAYRAFRIGHGDQSIELWDHAKDTQRTSTIAAVEFIQANPHKGDEALHVRWAADKVADGWGYGTTFDETAKTNPLLVPFSELPAEVAAKFKLFRAIVLALI